MKTNSTNPNDSCQCPSQPVYPHPPVKCCEYIIGNSTDIKVDHDDCEIKADIVVDRKKGVRIWGQVKDCEGNPVPGVLVKLIKEVCTWRKPEYIGVAHTVTDCNGFYQFEVICPPEHKYKVIVSKAATGEERVVKNNNCRVCEEDC